MLKLQRYMPVRSGAVNVEAIPADRLPSDDLRRFHGALAYDAPFLVEKLIKDQIVDSAAEGELLFTEVKRYLVLTRLDPHVAWQMYSTRVDEVWHQFVLFTREYGSFCDGHLGGFAHHRPSNAPAMPPDHQSERSTFRSFAARYREVFGEELPDCWKDERSITLARRLIGDKTHRLVVSEHAGRVSLVDESGTVRFSVDSIAREAVTFIATTRAFYVRELPGDLTDEERIAIAATLVEQRLLRVAS
jgi:hypothetical protein